MNMYHNIILGVIVVLILDILGTQVLMNHQNSMPKSKVENYYTILGIVLGLCILIGIICLVRLTVL